MSWSAIGKVAVYLVVSVTITVVARAWDRHSPELWVNPLFMAGWASACLFMYLRKRPQPPGDSNDR